MQILTNKLLKVTSYDQLEDGLKVLFGTRYSVDDPTSGPLREGTIWVEEGASGLINYFLQYPGYLGASLIASQKLSDACRRTGLKHIGSLPGELKVGGPHDVTVMYAYSKRLLCI